MREAGEGESGRRAATHHGRLTVIQSKVRMARWQSGHAAACKAVYAGSIPTLASIRLLLLALESSSEPLTSQRPGGEIGRRKGLKIPRRESVMPVRVRLRACLISDLALATR